MPLPSAFLNNDLISSWLKAQLNRPANVSDFARSGLLGSSFAGQDCSRTVEGQRAKDLRVEGGPERLPISHEHKLNSLIHCHNTISIRIVHHIVAHDKQLSGLEAQRVCLSDSAIHEVKFLPSTSQCLWLSPRLLAYACPKPAALPRTRNVPGMKRSCLGSRPPPKSYPPARPFSAHSETPSWSRKGLLFVADGVFRGEEPDRRGHSGTKVRLYST